MDFLYRDEHLVVLNKPAGYLSIPDRFVPEKPNLVHQLEGIFEKIWVVHRLDKETSGAICFARNQLAGLSKSVERRLTDADRHI